MDKLLMATVITIMSSFFIVPVVAGYMIKASFWGKVCLLVISIAIVGAFLLMYGLKKDFEVGSWFTPTYNFVACLFMAQVYFGLLMYFMLILKAVHLPVPHSIAISMSIAIIMTAFAFYNGKGLNTTNISIKLPNLQKELIIAHLPDIHLGHFQTKNFLQQVVNETNKHNPDIVILNGDLFEDHFRLQKNVKEGLSQFKGKVIFTQGNHETYVDYNEIKELVKNLGYTHLANNMIEIDGVQFVGTDYLDADKDSVGAHPSPNDIYLKDFLQTITLDKAKPSVLIEHAPYGTKYAKEKGFDLMISGHTHGNGQMWPFTLFKNAHFDVAKGLAKMGDLSVYVSGGVGTFGVPLRLGTKNEINIIKLEKK